MKYTIKKFIKYKVNKVFKQFNFDIFFYLIFKIFIKA